MALPIYTTVEKVKAAMPDSGFEGVDTYDVILSFLVERASRAIDVLFKRTPGAFKVEADTIRYFDAKPRKRGLFIDDLAQPPTLIEVNENGDRVTWQALAATDYYLLPYNAEANGVPYDEIELDLINGTRLYWPPYRKAIRITGRWGYSITVPGPIEQATISQVGRWFKRGQQGFQDAGAIVDLGQLTYVNEIDPDIRAMLATNYKRVTV